MAKHKKKKSAPTPDPDKSKEQKTPPEEQEKQETPTKETDIPPTEKIEDSKAEPVEEQSSETKKKLDKLFWLRIGFAVIGGIIATFIFEPIEGEERRWTSIGFMIGLFIITAFIGKGMKIQLPRSDRKKLVTTGIGSFIFIYLFMWIISYTLVNLSINGGGIPSPLP